MLPDDRLTQRLSLGWERLKWMGDIKESDLTY